MEATVKTYPCPDGQIQRVHLVRPDSWEALEFLSMEPDPGALDCFAKIYRQFLVPACPWLFGHMVMFRLPEGMEVPFSRETDRYGTVASPLTAAAAALEAGVRIHGNTPHFRNPQVEAFWKALEAAGCIRIVSGKLPITTIIPVGGNAGYLSRTAPEAALKVNSSFFIMDRFDCATVHDHIGTVLGLCVRRGIVENPPLYGREALLVRQDGTVRVETPKLEDLTLEIRGRCYRPGVDLEIFSRPEHLWTPARKGTKLVLVGCRVAAVTGRSRVKIPASGVVVCLKDPGPVEAGDAVIYHGMEDVVFGIQVGNSLMVDGEKTRRFRSRFYNIRGLEPVPFPPSLYPLNYREDRAARIALGADAEGKPMLLWAEGAAKIGHQKGVDSQGASLWELEDICCDLGMVSGVNLDGGGSAQILLQGQRHLRISDRNPDGTQAERLIPMGLMIK